MWNVREFYTIWFGNESLDKLIYRHLNKEEINKDPYSKTMSKEYCVFLERMLKTKFSNDIDYLYSVVLNCQKIKDIE